MDPEGVVDGSRTASAPHHRIVRQHNGEPSGTTDTESLESSDVFEHVVARDWLRSLIAQYESLPADLKVKTADEIFQLNEYLNTVHDEPEVNYLAELRVRSNFETNDRIGVTSMQFPCKGVLEVRLAVKHRPSRCEARQDGFEPADVMHR